MRASTASGPSRGGEKAGCRPCLSDRLAAEHRELARELGLFLRVGDEADEAPRAAFLRDVDRVSGWLTQRVIPHIHAEHELRARLAVRDHRPVAEHEGHAAIAELARRLAELRTRLKKSDDHHVRAEVRRVLDELYALTRLHFEDEVGEPAR